MTEAVPNREAILERIRYLKFRSLLKEELFSVATNEQLQECTKRIFTKFLDSSDRHVSLDLDKQLSELPGYGELSVRLHNVLATQGEPILTAKQLVSSRDVLDRRGCGKQCRQELRSWMAQNNLAFKEKS